MSKQNAINDRCQESNYPTTYREVRIGRTIYRVTSIFTGEKDLGATLEKLAAQRVLDEMDGRVKAVLYAN